MQGGKCIHDVFVAAAAFRLMSAWQTWPSFRCRKPWQQHTERVTCARPARTTTEQGQ